MMLLMTRTRRCSLSSARRDRQGLEGQRAKGCPDRSGEIMITDQCVSSITVYIAQLTALCTRIHHGWS